jgi:GT2 family glycosyltransferase
VRKNWPQVKIIQEKTNTGFAEGNNIGIREALKNPEVKYIATLNNDTEVKNDWLHKLVEVAERDGKIGAVCSKTLFFSQRNLIDSAGDFLLAGTLKAVTRGYKQKDKGQFEQLEECFSARAAAALYRREMLEDVREGNDFFDRHFFAYIEDTDLSVRARWRRWKIMYEPRAVVYHKVAQTSSRLSHVFRRYHSGRNRLFTAIKNYPVSLWPMALRGTSSVDSDYRLSAVENVKVYGKIMGSLIVALPRLWRQRREIQRQKKISDNEIKGWVERFCIK